MCDNKTYRILLTSDMHCTDLMDWYGVRDGDRLQHWVDCILAEHAKQPFDLILIPGDISLDYHAEKTPYDKGHSTGLIFMQQFFSQLPDVPRFILAGNHEQFTREDWRALVGNERQGALSVGKYTFLMMDNFAEDLGPVYDSSDKYTQMDVDFIRAQLDAHPDHEFYLVSHYFSMEKESEAFRTLVATEPRIRGLFMGHTHLNTVIALGEDYASKVIAQTGNFSYTCGDVHRDFWGFRDLVIAPDGTAISSYIIPESTIHPGGNTLTIQAKTVDVVTM